MISINLRTSIYPLLLRTPSVPHHWCARVQLWKVIGTCRVPAPKLHRGGYRASPTRATPLCMPRGGPKGRAVYYRAGSTPPYRECPECEALYRARHGGTDVEAEHAVRMRALDLRYGAESVSTTRSVGLYSPVLTQQAMLQWGRAVDSEESTHDSQ